MSKRNYIVLLILSTLIASCTRSDCWRLYSFEFPVMVYPSNDTINIGDTLWFEINIEGNLLEDKATSEIMDLSDIELKLRFGIYKFDTTEFLIATNSFNPFAEIGEIDPFNSVHTNIKFSNNGDKHVKIGLVPSIPGGYVLSVSRDSKQTDDDMMLLNFNSCQCTEKYKECLETYNKEETKAVINNYQDHNRDLLIGKYVLSRDFTTGEVIDTSWWISPNGTVDDTPNNFAFYVD